MTQPNAQDILEVLYAPALACSTDGLVVAMNDYAAKWLRTDGATTKLEQQRLLEVRCQTVRILDARSLRKLACNERGSPANDV